MVAWGASPRIHNAEHPSSRRAATQVNRIDLRRRYAAKHKVSENDSWGLRPRLHSAVATRLKRIQP